MLLDGLVRIFNGVGLSKQWRWDEILVGAEDSVCEEMRGRKETIHRDV